MFSTIKRTLLLAIFVPTAIPWARAQQPGAAAPANPPQSTSAPAETPGYTPQPSETQAQTPLSAEPGESPQFTRIVDTIIARENELVRNLRNYRPRVETYIQDMRSDSELGAVPVNDHYFLGRLEFKRNLEVRSFLPEPGLGSRLVKDFVGDFSRIYSLHYQPLAFAYTIVMDTSRFDRRHYKFEFVRREFLGDVRCMVFDVTPRPHSGIGLFEGRIWVEDQDYDIVRFNGTYAPAPRFSSYFHFDSWREELQPGVWLPVYGYSEESDLHYSVNRTLRFRGQTRLWGYDLGNPNRQSELTRIVVDAPNDVQDRSPSSIDPSPVASEREWQREAEENVLDRLVKAGLLAPPGDVDKVMETVVNNLIVTNQIENLPPVHCRVLLTSPIESFAVGSTIVLSRGLIDVLPDEASLAAMLAHELAHILLQHTVNINSTQYAFEDRLLLSDEDILGRIQFRPNEHDEEAADAKALQLLKNSPYKDQLGKAGLFLRSMADMAPHTPNLFGAHMGNRMVQGDHVRRLAELMTNAPQLQKTRVDQIAALPLGARLKVDPWSDQVRLVRSQPAALLSAREKMPFEVTPLFPCLARFGNAEEAADQSKPPAAAASSPAAAPPSSSHASH